MQWLAARNSIEGIFTRETASTITDELIALDDARDQFFNGINALVLGHTYSSDATVKQHAIKLQFNIDSYGSGIARENYQSETAIITNLLSDWTTQPDLATAITALNLASWKADLTTANTAFNTKYLNRTQEIGALPAENMKEQRLAANSAYYELRDHLTSYCTINKGVAPFGKTVNELNALIDQYNRTLASHTTKPVAEPVTP